ncbi:transposase (plasmid) [Citrobacter meridianamericanus]
MPADQTAGRGRFLCPSASDGKVFLTLTMLMEGIYWRQPK